MSVDSTLRRTILLRLVSGTRARSTRGRQTGIGWRNLMKQECNNAANTSSTPRSITTDLDEPSLIHALTPQTFLLGTDSGLLHLYDLRLPPSFTTSTTSSSPFPNPRPSSTFRPHHPKDSTAPPETEPLTSLTALPPTTASTSQTSRAFVTTAAATLAVTDIRKGIVALSEDQGDLLLSSTCVSGLALSKAAKRRAAGADAGGSDEKIVVGGAGGVLTLWNRGEWGDQGSRIKIAGSGTSGAFDAIASGTQGFASQADDDDCTVDSLCAIPDHVSGLERVARAGKLVVAGLGNGGVRVVRLRGGGGEVVGTVRHDEGGVEGVVTLGWESEGRMVSGGGNVVKVWGVVGENEEQEEEEEEEEVRAVGGVNSASNGMTGDDDDDDEVDEDDEEPVVVMGDVDESDEDDSDDDSSDDDRHKRKKRNKGKKGSKGGNHGISGSFRGMD